MPGRINGFSLAYTAAGAVVLWSGIKGSTLSATFRGLLKGQAPAGGQEPVTAAQAVPGPGGGGNVPPGDTAAHSGSAVSNQAIARLLAAPYGWAAGTQWADLVSLWNRESGWNQYAENPSSGAYGIAQALPPSKYPPAAQKAGGSSPSSQISWGLAYIKDVYGSPAGAWAHEQSAGWY